MTSETTSPPVATTLDPVDALQATQVVVFALATLSELRDSDTESHMLRVQRYVRALCTQLQTLPAHAEVLTPTYVEMLITSVPIYDMGTVGIPDRILLKPGRLTPEEFEVMKLHASYGYEILKDSSSLVLQAGAAIALGHHEKFDGTGYPQGLKGEAIPIFSRIVAVADVFDALTSARPYKPAWELRDAAAHIQAQSGSHFDPDCVRVFFEHWGAVLDIRARFQDEDTLFT